MNEIWKSIKNFERYEVSSIGRIRNKVANRILKVCLLNTGYCQIELCKFGIKKKFLVHRLMLSAFLYDDERQVNHKNGVKNDNRLENLEYMTASEQRIHALKTGLTKSACGEQIFNSSITSIQAKEVKIRLANKERPIDISYTMKISDKIVRDIKAGRSWKQII